MVRRCQEARREPLRTELAGLLSFLQARELSLTVSVWPTPRQIHYLLLQRHWATLDPLGCTASPMLFSPGTPYLQASQSDFEDCSQNELFSAQEIPRPCVLPGAPLYKPPFPIFSLIPMVSLFHPKEMLPLLEAGVKCRLPSSANSDYHSLENFLVVYLSFP